MRIIQINSVFGRGSTGRIAANIHNFLKQEGYESYVFYGRGKKSKQDNVKKFGNNISFIIHVILSRLFDMHGLSSHHSTKKMIKNIDSIRPDVIHLHNIHGYYLNFNLLFKYLKKNFDGKIIWTLHDCWSFTGHCAYYTFANCDKWNTKCHDCPEIKSYPKSLTDHSEKNFIMKKKTFSGLKNLTIVTPSLWLNLELNKSFLSQYNKMVINNGVDTSIFTKRVSALRERFNIQKKFIILGVANIWDKRKGLKYLIELSKIISDTEVIIIIGLTKSQIRVLPKNVIGIERTENSIELAEFYSISDVYVNPTLEDNYPTTNLEALCCETPVITFNTGGSPEMVGMNGIILNEKTANMIYDAILRIKDGSIRFNFIKNDQLDFKYSTRKYINLYIQ
ncbi:MAG: glycosyltransferase [bacterium]